MMKKVYQENFKKSFVQRYLTAHHLETNKLRNVAKFFYIYWRHIHSLGMHPVGRGRNIINSNFCKSYISGIFLVLFSAFALHNSLLPSYHNIELLLPYAGTLGAAWHTETK
jgi:hypothetical protein